MPSIKDIPGPYRFYFYSFDCNEPMHVHVQRERMVCKFWLEPVALAQNHGFSPRELTRFVRIQEELNNIQEKCVTIAVNSDARVKEVSVTDDLITFHLI